MPGSPLDARARPGKPTRLLRLGAIPIFFEGAGPSRYAHEQVLCPVTLGKKWRAQTDVSFDERPIFAARLD